MQIDEEEEKREELAQRAEGKAEEGRGGNEETHEGEENEEGDDTHHVSKTRARGVSLGKLRDSSKCTILPQNWEQPHYKWRRISRC